MQKHGFRPFRGHGRLKGESTGDYVPYLMFLQLRDSSNRAAHIGGREELNNKYTMNFE